MHVEGAFPFSDHGLSTSPFSLTGQALSLIYTQTTPNDLAESGLRAREPILERNRRIVSDNLPNFDAFFAQYPDLFDWQPPQGGCVTFPRYRGAEGVEAMCTELVEQEGVLLLPASIYSSMLTRTPVDRFRLGIGRYNPHQALQRWATWLDKRR